MIVRVELSTMSGCIVCRHRGEDVYFSVVLAFWLVCLCLVLYGLSC